MVDKPLEIYAPIGAGELLDKITILEIKLTHARDPRQVENIRRELDKLNQFIDSSWASVIHRIKPRLREVNQLIWDAEEKIRNKHSDRDYGDEFTACAIEIFERNDERAEIKRAVNNTMRSEVVEEKIYTHFSSGSQPC